MPPITQLLCVTVFLSSVQATCDLNCYFPYPYITAENLKRWPKSCVEVCGDLILSGNINVTEAKLAQIFHKLEWLGGKLKIENTNFTTLDFLSKLRGFDCSSQGLPIINNQFLTSIAGIQNLATYCEWKIFNNTRLDMNAFIYSRGFSSLTYLVTAYGNMKDADCLDVRITSETLPFYPNCSIIKGGSRDVLLITNVTENDNFSKFSSLQEVHGHIEVFGTTLQNLSFMNHFHTHVWEVNPLQNNTNIHDNPKLTRLGWDSLKALPPSIPDSIGYQLNIQNNHPDFCLTIEELQVFFESSPRFANFEAKMCPELTRKDGQKVCNWDTLSTMPDGCQHIIGDVIISYDNEKDVGKLKKLTNIYGTLTITSTEGLVDLSVFAKLRQVAMMNCDAHSAIRITKNKKLQSATFPSMMGMSCFFYNDFMTVQVNENSLEIFKNRRECMLLEAQAKTSVKYKGKRCCEFSRF
ncbi:hypothetical protein CAEBREN_07380 [Caenorhabditis brenneri]|uniref:Receptor L-domain domain-containing protein n=1 Tax=Caenorhabditis brenneri TaxID=135651 RepID=G0M8S5_CAEBE|nr:hypothetical protein CAEBREN_07380 [Caenorhabditis brenneri]